MPYFHVGQQRLITETYLVEANNIAEAREKIRANNGQGRLFDVNKGEILEASIVAMPYDGLNCEFGEQVFEVEVGERHNSKHLITAKNPEDAVMKVREGEGDCLYDTEYVETLSTSDWNVRDEAGNLVA